MGQACKLFLQWSDSWWVPNEGGIQLAWPSDYSHYLLTGGSGDAGGKYRNKDYERHWYRHLSNFAEVENQPNMLVTWVAGEAAKVVDKLDDEEVTNYSLNYALNRPT